MTITLHKPATKLAGLYLAIIMAISLFFSANVYQLSMQEFDRGLRGTVVEMPVNIETGVIAKIKNQLIEEQNKRYQAAKRRVLTRLVLTNIGIFIGGGFLSYYLARRTLRPIEEAHEAQSRFTADASHELRTPLTAMQSEIEVALMNPNLTLSQAKQRLRSNLEELGKLTALSEGLLRLAQLENHEIHRRTVILDRLVQQAVDRVLSTAEQKNMLVTIRVPEGVRLPGDEVSLAEVLVILLDNAIKYSPEKTEIEVRASLSPKTVTIAVQDQGMGIKATELPHVFDRFYRADTARNKQRTQGYGLGLAIAKNIVDLHAGSITVHSRPGSGSTFEIILPRQ